MTSGQFIALLAEVGFQVRSYSGRGMYGARCVSVTMDRNSGGAAELAAETVSAAYETSDNEIAPLDVARAFKRTKWDSMGLDTVYYWTDFDWPADIEEDDDEDDDE